MSLRVGGLPPTQTAHQLARNGPSTGPYPAFMTSATSNGDIASCRCVAAQSFLHQRYHSQRFVMDRSHRAFSPIHLYRAKPQGTPGLRCLAQFDSRGFVRVATPFEILWRDPLLLPPMVAMAVEMPENKPDMRRLAELTQMAAAEDVRRKLSALQELVFFPLHLACPVVTGLASDRDELVRAQAVFSGAILLDGVSEEDVESFPLFGAMVEKLTSDRSPTVRSACATALAHLTGDEVLNALTGALGREEDWLVRMCVAVSLGTLGDRRAAPRLRDELVKFNPASCEADSLIVQGMIGALSELHDTHAIRIISSFRCNSDFLIRQQVAEALQVFDDIEVITVLEQLSSDPVEVVSRQAKVSLDAIRKRQLP
mmetsp:Transcript_5314/g.10909  ORF Transcript_5314/g.10909 Transcript_5314/m.10909 type:complete len:370 (-) Transcript_5314:1020-2129(-)|eukprot:CAMPEP_0184689926 /NCGR_PEP_ID=MMETSP0312-20130426/30929_1 /TAXON_ID=31354 /ORGANISM="Compsopogon coeruleus, Strain SAG 36.94" /LENGTH=369 /DNA_ID=CAMNT_0027147335 /DNA_START=2695 /DNA_END=3804 /DNA_ORIENTATION=-